MATYKQRYNGGAFGPLPPLSVTRANSAVDATGALRAPGVPRYGLPCMSTSFPEWTNRRTHNTNISVAGGGYDRDGRSPLSTYFLNAISVMEVWASTPSGTTVPNSPAPDWRLPMDRDPVGGGDHVLLDILKGDAIQEDHTTHVPSACVVLDGCIVWACRRRDNLYPSSSSSNISTGWADTGVSLIALQHESNDSWTLSKIGETSGVVESGVVRGGNHTLSVFPNTLNQDPLSDVWLVQTDYRSTTKTGGELYICRATRADRDSNWVFDTYYKIFATDQRSNTHFHSAAWTPNGVVLATGEAPPSNEVILFTCDDWDNYDVGGNWTAYRRFHGAPILTSSTSSSQQDFGTYGCQFMRTAPHKSDLNKFWAAGDVTESPMFEITVPGNPEAEIGIKRGIGFHHTNHDTGTGNKGWTNFHMDHKGCRGDAYAMQSSIDGGVQADTFRTMRIHYSEDGDNWASIATRPVWTDADATPPSPVFHGDAIYFARSDAAGVTDPGYISEIATPTLAGPFRPLSVAPGGQNRMILDSGQLYNAASTSGNSATYDGSASAPAAGPCYDVVGGRSAASGTWMTFDFTDGTTIPQGDVWVVTWVKNNGPEGSQIRGSLESGAVYENSTGRVNTNGEWCPVTFWFPGTSFGANYAPSFEFRSADNAAQHVDFTVCVQGIYVQDPIPYQVPENSTGVDEEIAQPLPTFSGSERTVLLELEVPYHGYDWQTNSTLGVATVPLATIWCDADNYVEIVADLQNDEVDFTLQRAGAPIGTATLSGFTMVRGDSMLLGVSFNDDTPLTSVYAACGGLTDTGLASDTSTLTNVPAVMPTEVRFGDNDFTTVPVIDVLSVSVDTTEARDGDGILELGNPETEGISGGSGPIGLRTSPYALERRP